MGDVFVAEDFYLGAGETSAVDYAGVIELVGEDEVLFAEDAGDGSGVCGEAGLEDDAGFGAFEGGDLFFEFHVDAHGSGYRSDSSGTDAVFLRCGDGGFAKSGIVAESEVVV